MKGLHVRTDPYVAHRVAILHKQKSASAFLNTLLRQAHARVEHQRTGDEESVLSAIDAGCYEFEQIAAHLGWRVDRPNRGKKDSEQKRRWRHLERILAWLLDQGDIEIVRKGGQYEARGGARTRYYARAGAVTGSAFDAQPRRVAGPQIDPE